MSGGEHIEQVSAPVPAPARPTSSSTRTSRSAVSTPTRLSAGTVSSFVQRTQSTTPGSSSRVQRSPATEHAAHGPISRVQPGAPMVQRDFVGGMKAVGKGIASGARTVGKGIAAGAGAVADFGAGVAQKFQRGTVLSWV